MAEDTEEGLAVGADTEEGLAVDMEEAFTAADIMAAEDFTMVGLITEGRTMEAFIMVVVLVIMVGHEWCLFSQWLLLVPPFTVTESRRYCVSHALLLLLLLLDVVATVRQHLTPLHWVIL